MWDLLDRTCCLKGKWDPVRSSGVIILNNVGIPFEVCLDPASQRVGLVSFHLIFEVVPLCTHKNVEYISMTWESSISLCSEVLFDSVAIPWGFFFTHETFLVLKVWVFLCWLFPAFVRSYKQPQEPLQ